MRRLRLRVPALLAVVLLVAQPIAGSPAAANRGPHPFPSRSPSAAEQAADSRYWTPERMAQATETIPVVEASRGGAGTLPERGRPVEIPGSPPVRQSPFAAPAIAARNAASASDVSGISPRSVEYYWTGPVNYPPQAQVGRLFYKHPNGSAGFCSATIVASANRSIVWTAGHCVYTPVNRGRGVGWHTAFRFCAAYRQGCTYGEWGYVDVSTTNQWFSNENFNFDFGILKMAIRGGYKIGNYFGYQGIGFNKPSVAYRTSFGYPQADSRWASNFDGSWMYTCQMQNYINGNNNMEITCTMTGGASGGPWLTDFNGYYGTVQAVNSNKPACNVMVAPYQGNVAYNLWAYWQNR